jgi:parvulin-like peptidyl-prolyl isomerase
MRRALVFAIFIACTPKEPPVELVAKVNGQGITRPEFDAHVSRTLDRYKDKQQQMTPKAKRHIEQSALRRLIDDKIIEVKAQEAGVAVTDPQVEEKYQEHRSRFRTDQAYDDYLQRANTTAEIKKEEIKRNLLRDALVEKLTGAIAVTDEEAKAYYDERQQKFTEKAQVLANRIVVRVPQGDDKAAKEAAKKAKGLYKKATGKGADFEALAKEVSEGPEASRGGSMGWVTKGRMPGSFDDVVFAMEKGKVSAPIETRLGWEIVQVVDSRPEQIRPYDTVKENIVRSLEARKKNEKRREVLRDLRKDATIEKILALDDLPDDAPTALDAQDAVDAQDALDAPPDAPRPPPVADLQRAMEKMAPEGPQAAPAPPPDSPVQNDG